MMSSGAVRHCAFTLLEMVAVLVIAALVAAMAVAMLMPGGVQGEPAGRHADEVAELLTAARRRAEQTGEVQSVGVLRDPLRWVWAEGGKEVAVPPGLEITRMERGSGIGGVESEREETDAEPEDLTKLFRFTSSRASGTGVRLSDAGTERFITVSALTGAIIVTDHEPEPPELLWEEEDQR